MNLLETFSYSFCPTLSASPRNRPRAAAVLGGRRLRARGEEVFHCELARISTGMGVWIGAKMIIADPVALGSPILINFIFV